MSHRQTKNSNARIAYILKMFPRLSETFIANEILALSTEGFDITIYSIKRPRGPIHVFMEQIRIPIQYLPALSRKYFFVLFYAHLYTLIKRPRGYMKCFLYSRRKKSAESRKKFLYAGYISKSIIQKKIQHLHSHFATGSTRLAKYIHFMTGVPFSFTAHAKDIYSDRVTPKQLKRRLKMALFTVTISKYNREFLIKICPYAKIHLIRNGIRIEDFKRNGENARDYEKPMILSVGRLVEKKGFTHLIDACALLKKNGVEHQCSIIGDGPLRKELDIQIEKLGLEDTVTLEGSKVQEELITEYYAKASIFVLPCVIADNRDMDGLPVVLIEAMAMGIPVISSQIAGIPEVVSHRQTGLLVKPGNSQELARSIHRLLGDKILRERLTTAAKALVEKEFDLRTTSRQLAGVFENAIRA